jgi:sugar phosphate isomerase/epimerase
MCPRWHPKSKLGPDTGHLAWAGADPVDVARRYGSRVRAARIRDLRSDPPFVEFVPELPLTENGKVRKAILREQGVTPRTWDREAAGYELAR